MTFEEFYACITEGVYGEAKSIEDTEIGIGRSIVYHWFGGFGTDEAIEYIKENHDELIEYANKTFGKQE